MVRHGMVTIGVAVQAETFSNSDNNAPGNAPTTPNTLNPNLATSSTSTTSKSAIFLPPSRNGAPQTLKITFAYNKDTDLPEVIINLNEEGEDQYLKLKELATQQNQGTNDLKYLPLTGGGGQSNSTSSFNNKSKTIKDNSNAVQVYYFENQMDKPYTTQVFDVTPMKSVPVPVPQTSPKAIEDGNQKLSTSADSGQMKTKTEEGKSRSNSMDKGQGQGDIKERETEDKGSDDCMKSPKKSVGSPTKKQGVKKVTLQDGKENNEKAISPKTINEDGGNGKSSSKSSERLGRRKSKTRSLDKEISSYNIDDLRAESPSKSDRSKIPVINSAATGFMPCEYYRQKWLQEQGCTDPSSWNNYSSIQKTAGQKVVNKMTAQQKKLEEDAAAHRKRTDFVFHDEMGACEVPHFIPIRKKQTRLEPLRSVPKCH